jgi:dimethylhistidine N-methyltransferase
MTTIAYPQVLPSAEIRVATAVRDGLSASPKTLPAWLFYDEAGSELFEQITRLPEYYVTRTERRILADRAAEIVVQAAGQRSQSSCWDAPQKGQSRLRIAELGAGSADKTRLLLRAAVRRQRTLIYEPIDVSPTALEAARERIEREIPGVSVMPRVLDYTEGLALEPAIEGERRILLYIGSSIGNFEPPQAQQMLRGVCAGLNPGDTILLGVDLRKDEATLLAAYDDNAGVTAQFNLNLLARMNRDLDANFDLDSFEHCAVWNESRSRIEMHLESLVDQRVKFPSLNFEVRFDAGERIHTENSYKYSPGQAEELLAAAGFTPESTWTDDRNWFAVCLARVA